MWPSARRLRAALLVGVLVVLSVSAVRAGGQSGPGLVETTEDIFIVKVQGDFEEVLGLLEDAIKQQNYFIAGYTEIDVGLKKRAKLTGKPFGFAHYKIVNFCNLTLGDRALRANPHIGAFMPCRLAVYAYPNSKEVFVVSMRPTYMARIFRSKEVEALARDVEADVLEILEFVASF